MKTPLPSALVGDAPSLPTSNTARRAIGLERSVFFTHSSMFMSDSRSSEVGPDAEHQSAQVGLWERFEGCADHVRAGGLRYLTHGAKRYETDTGLVGWIPEGHPIYSVRDTETRSQSGCSLHLPTTSESRRRSKQFKPGLFDGSIVALCTAPSIRCGCVPLQTQHS